MGTYSMVCGQGAVAVWMKARARRTLAGRAPSQRTATAPHRQDEEVLGHVAFRFESGSGVWMCYCTGPSYFGAGYTWLYAGSANNTCQGVTPPP